MPICPFEKSKGAVEQRFSESLFKAYHHAVGGVVDIQSDQAGPQRWQTTNLLCCALADLNKRRDKPHISSHIFKSLPRLIKHLSPNYDNTIIIFLRNQSTNLHSKEPPRQVSLPVHNVSNAIMSKTKGKLSCIEVF